MILERLPSEGVMFLAEFQAFKVIWSGVLLNLTFYLGCLIAIVLIVIMALRFAISLLGFERPRKK